MAKIYKYRIKDLMWGLPQQDRLLKRAELRDTLGIKDVMLSRYLNSTHTELLEFDPNELVLVRNIFGMRSVTDVYTDEYHAFLLQSVRDRLVLLEC